MGANDKVEATFHPGDRLEAQFPTSLEFSIAQIVKEEGPLAYRTYSRAAANIMRLVTHNVVCLCGSSRFKDQFISEGERLTAEGKIVLTTGLFGQADMKHLDWSTDATDFKRMLDELHFEKIMRAEQVHVINVDGYIGESTAREIRFAEMLGKKITYMEGHNG